MLYVGRYYYKFSKNYTVDLYLTNVNMKNKCIIINSYKCPVALVTKGNNKTQYSRNIFVSIIVPTLTNPLEWITNSPEGNNVVTKATTSDGDFSALLKNSFYEADTKSLSRYGLSIVYLYCGGRDDFGKMSQDENTNSAYPPPAIFNLPTFFGIDNVEVQDTLYNYFKNDIGVYYPWEDDPSKPGGGEGKWDDDTSDDIDLPNIDDLNVNAINATQFMTLYQLSQDQLKNLGNALWSGNFLQALSNSALKPMDYILSFCMLPVYAGGTVKSIKAGGFLLSDMTEGVTVNGTVTTNQYVRVDCGELEINEKWGGAIDYQTDLTLYLPFIGMVKLSPQDVMNGKIKVVYTVDLLTGNCIATVKVTKGVLNSVLYNFTGNCSSSYPLSSRDFSTVFGSLITASSSIMGASTATKNASSLPDKTKRQKYLKAKATESATSSWEGTGMQATNNLISGNFSPDVVRCGTMSANVGFMGIKKPFLIISRLKQSLPDNFGRHAGYMCNITKKLADCKGFTQIRFIHLDGIIATNTEKNELDSLLKEGVIIE